MEAGQCASISTTDIQVQGRGAKERDQESLRLCSGGCLVLGTGLAQLISVTEEH